MCCSSLPLLGIRQVIGWWRAKVGSRNSAMCRRLQGREFFPYCIHNTLPSITFNYDLEKISSSKMDLNIRTPIGKDRVSIFLVNVKFMVESCLFKETRMSNKEINTWNVFFYSFFSTKQLYNSPETKRKIQSYVTIWPLVFVNNSLQKRFAFRRI